MSSPFIYSGNFAKSLKQNLNLHDAVYILSGSTDPTSSATTAPKGSLYLNNSTGLLYRKLDSGSSTNWATVDTSSSGDLTQTSFSLANNQAVAADVTGFLFSNASVRSFEALVSVTIDATSDLFEQFSLYGIQRGADWQMSQSATGDNSQVVFSITNSGQLQYTSGNYAGFNSGTIKFRAVVTNV